MTRKDFLTLSAAALASPAVSQAQQSRSNPDLGFTDTPTLPGQPWHVHDSNRPHPKQVTPAATPGGPPSDAIVLFDGKDLSKWQQHGRGPSAGKLIDAQWKVENGYFICGGGTGDLQTRDSFADIQLHVEWSSPTEVRGTSQGRGNSGIIIMSRYEVQVLDMWDNVTYADGGAGAIYGQWPPLVTPARKPGEWNTYDIVFEAPRFEGEKVASPAYLTVFYNGVLVHHRKASMGPMVYRQVAKYAPHPPEMPLMLQDHNNPVRYRNIWLRKLGKYDQP